MRTIARDIASDVSGLRDVFLYTVDDLERAIEDNRRSRREAAAEADAIIELQVARYIENLHASTRQEPLKRLRAHGDSARDEILANFQTIQAAIQSPATGSSKPLNTNDPGIQTLVQQNQILQQTVQTLVENDKRKSEEVTRLTNLLSRYLTNGQRAA